METQIRPTAIERQVYRRSGVQEYLVWQVDDRRIDWWELQAGEYVGLEPAAGVLQSRVFPGLWLDVAALLAGDLAGVLARLNQGLAGAEHAGFVQRLQETAGPAQVREEGPAYGADAWNGDAPEPAGGE